MKHLFLFTITPVQSFIAEARKISDLAAGSKLLSQLVDDAMRYLTIKGVSSEKDIIFPSLQIESKPNRFLVYIHTNTPTQVGVELENYIRQERFIGEAKSKLKEYYGENINEAIKQLNDFLKIFWVVIPATNDYPADNIRIERLLGGIKNFRPFSQLEEKGRKCSINGEYNVTIFKRSESKSQPKWLEYTKNVMIYEPDVKTPNLKKLNRGEGLCTMNFYKRIYLHDNKSFDATCQIAYLDMIQSIENDETRKEIKELQKINEQYIYKDAVIEQPDDKNAVIELQSNIYSYLKNRKIKPCKYYAVLAFDADRLGKWFSGEYLSKVDKDQLSFQKRLSSLFGDFAKFAREYVDGKKSYIEKGQTVYAGGDDFLGLINLSYLFDVLNVLHKKFFEIVWQNGISVEYEFKEGTKPITFSAGVAIAHYKTPLSHVLNEARKSEKSAKSEEEGNRAALAITVLKRSGEVHKSVTKWHDSNGHFLLHDIQAITQALIAQESSNKFITSFSQEFLPILNRSNVNLYKDMAIAELSRLLKDHTIEHVRESAGRLLEAQLENTSKLESFIFLLNSADFISREVAALKKDALCQ